VNKFDLSGRVAVVTGAAQGFGRAITERFLQSGAAVAMWDFDKAELDKAARELEGMGSVIPVQVDVSDLAAVDGATADTIKALKQIDILVGNAGIAGPNHKIWEYPVDDWRKVIEINLFGIYYTNRAVLPNMLERNYGRIINIASVMGQRGGIGASNYSAAKGGLIAFTRATALELAPFNITVNAVCPGWVPTDLNARLDDTQRAELLKGIPLGRFGRPEEVAAMVRFLVVEGDWITGQQMNVNGGEYM
jgi:3-oxoacyl-[acyl-carrier protein] reductase